METPTFANPPIVELALGVQFSPLTQFTSGHFGLLWKAMGDNWVIASDGPPIEDLFETFDGPRWPKGLELRLGTPPYPGRMILGHKDDTRIIQVQATRFHLNWRKRAGFYPSYKKLIAEFEVAFVRFQSFIEGAGLGRVLPNQWELTYVDSFPKGEAWATPADWPRFLPGLFSEPLPTDDLGVELTLDHRAAEWSYEIRPKLGRLHIAANYGRRDDASTEALLLTLTARGPVTGDGVASLRAGLDVGHQAAVGAFLKATGASEQARWGITA